MCRSHRPTGRPRALVSRLAGKLCGGESAYIQTILGIHIHLCYQFITRIFFPCLHANTPDVFVPLRATMSIEPHFALSKCRWVRFHSQALLYGGGLWNYSGEAHESWKLWFIQHKHSQEVRKQTSELKLLQSVFWFDGSFWRFSHGIF